MARRHSSLVCFNAEKLPQTSVLIVKGSFDVSSEEAPSYLAWAEGPLPEVAVATPHQGCATQPSHGHQGWFCSPCNHCGILRVVWRARMTSCNL